MAETVAYQYLEPGASPLSISDLAPFRAMVVIESEVEPRWRTIVSEWLVQSGCLYMLAWGHNCESWDTSVDEANLDEFDYGEIPEDKFVMTTWHADESMAEAFRFCKRHAAHPVVRLERTLLLHIGARSKEDVLLKSYAEA